MKNKFSIAMSLAVVLAMLLTSMALAAELVTAEVTGIANDVTVTQGTSVTSTINLSATGAIDCTITSANASTATVDTSYSLNSSGALTTGSPSSAFKFYSNGVPQGGSGNCGVTWDTASTPYSVTATFSAAATTPIGNYTVTLQDSSAGTTDTADITNPSVSGGKLGDTTPTTITVHVVAPVVTDSTPPVITPSVNCDNPGNAPWCKGTITVSWSVTDAESAITSSSGCGTSTISSDTGASGMTLTCNATSTGGTSSQSVTVYRDGTAPSISGSVSPAAAGTGWYNASTGAPTVSFACSDTGGSGLVSCTPASTLGNGADQSVTGTATDGAGNSASATVADIDVDLNAPTISASISPAASGTGWYNIATGAPTVSFSCNDTGGSGLAAGACPGSHSFGEGANQSFNATVTDIASNTSAPAGVSGINVDLTAPALNITGAASGTSGVCSALPSRPTFGPSDNLSGIASQSDSWTTPSTPSGVGTYTYNATATDVAGNTTSETRTYTVNYSGAFSGYLQPINTDGSSRFKLGSTIPVKFQLTCSGVSISNAVAKLYVAKGDNVPDPGVDEAISTAASTTGNLFRYDSTAQQYIFNLSTKLGYTNPGGSTVSFSTGTWTLKILLDDGNWYSVNVQLPR